MSITIARDLSKKLQEDLGNLLERNLNVAHHVLDSKEIAILLLEAAVMMVRTSTASIANLASDDADVPSIFDATTAAIVQKVQASRADGLARTMQVRREQR